VPGVAGRAAQAGDSRVAADATGRGGYA
jgi:hypothetical protein